MLFVFFSCKKAQILPTTISPATFPDGFKQ
jgi:hypothetical protein